MIKPISSIVWPSNPEESLGLYRKYMLSVVQEMGVSFDRLSPNPVFFLKRLMEGNATNDERVLALEALWGRVDEVGVRGFYEHDVLLLRLGICLLSVNDGSHSYGDELSWFLEVLSFMGMELHGAIDLMPKYFDYTGDEGGETEGQGARN